jgi:hypothetical protein
MSEHPDQKAVDDATRELLGRQPQAPTLADALTAAQEDIKRRCTPDPSKFEAAQSVCLDIDPVQCKDIAEMHARLGPSDMPQLKPGRAHAYTDTPEVYKLKKENEWQRRLLDNFHNNECAMIRKIVDAQNKVEGLEIQVDTLTASVDIQAVTIEELRAQIVALHDMAPKTADEESQQRMHSISTLQHFPMTDNLGKHAVEFPSQLGLLANLERGVP